MIGNIFWIWGLSGSGKTTLGYRLAKELGFLFLDSDIVRKVLHSPVDFSKEGRLAYQETLRAHVEELQYLENNIVVASITPLQQMRNLNRMRFDNYFEVYLKCDIPTLIVRDPKGLYRKALDGVLQNFTGISGTFEQPANDIGDENSIPDLVIDTTDEENHSYDKLYKAVLKFTNCRKVVNQ